MIVDIDFRDNLHEKIKTFFNEIQKHGIDKGDFIAYYRGTILSDFNAKKLKDVSYDQLEELDVLIDKKLTEVPEIVKMLRRSGI